MLKGKNKLRKYNLNVGLIAPARGTNVKKLSLAKKRLEFMGVKSIKHREKIVEKKFDYWAGDLNTRVSEIHEMFENKDVNLIWCLNGGMSSLELISELDFDKIKQNRKIFIGFSDITSLQNSFLHYAGLETIQFHMPGVKSWFNNKKEVSMLKNLLELKDNSVEVLAGQIHSSGNCSGQIVGGCLSLLCSSLGTPHEIDTRGKILYLEDTNCTPQRLYNDLCHLYLAGKFDSIKGLILSKMVNCGEYQRFLDLFLSKLSGKDIPIIKEIDAGHYKFKIPIVIGGKCSINSEKGIVSFGFSDKFKDSLRKKSNNELKTRVCSFSKSCDVSIKEILNVYYSQNFLSSREISFPELGGSSILHIFPFVGVGKKKMLIVEVEGKGKGVSETLFFKESDNGWIKENYPDYGLHKIKIIKLGKEFILIGRKSGKLFLLSGEDIADLKEKVSFSEEIQDLTLMKIEDKIGLFIQRNSGIDFLQVDGLDFLNEDLFSKYSRVFNFSKDEWGSVTQVYPLRNDYFGALGYVARKSKRSGNYFYYPFVFSFDLKTGWVSSPRVILRRGELPEGDARLAEEYNVILPGGMERKGSHSVLYATVGNHGAYEINIKDPFLYYERN